MLGTVATVPYQVGVEARPRTGTSKSEFFQYREPSTTNEAGGSLDGPAFMKALTFQTWSSCLLSRFYSVVEMKTRASTPMQSDPVRYRGAAAGTRSDSVPDRTTSGEASAQSSNRVVSLQKRHLYGNFSASQARDSSVAWACAACRHSGAH